MTGLSSQHKKCSILEIDRSRKSSCAEKMDVSSFSLSEDLRGDSITLSALLLWQVC